MRTFVMIHIFHLHTSEWISSLLRLIISLVLHVFCYSS